MIHGLGLNDDNQPKTSVSLGLRRGWFRHIGVVMGGASGTAVVLAGYEVLRAQPDKAFGLLQSWGPYFFVAILVVLTVGKLLEGMNQNVRESFQVVANAVQSSADAAGRTADALTKLAEQGGRQFQEVQRLALFAAQEFPSVYERFDRQDAMLEKQNQTMGDVAKAVMALTVRGNNDH